VIGGRDDDDGQERRTGRVWVIAAMACAVLVIVVIVATGTDGASNFFENTSESPSGEGASGFSSGGEIPPVAASMQSGGERSPMPLISNHERVQRHEALPCTGLDEPTNFEVFSAGPSPAGLSLNTVRRVCGASTPADEAPANFTSYIYGDCQIADDATGCKPPLEVQTWPACQRALGNYSFDGKPIPYTRLPSRSGAEVVEIHFMFGSRIEVYTKSSTVVLFAESPTLAREALGLLQSQETDKPPATRASELEESPEEGLEPPVDRATEGELQCQS
jgi:hypothetical protein